AVSNRRPDPRRHPERVEVVARYYLPPNRLAKRLISPTQVESNRRVSDQPSKRLRLVSPVEVGEIRERVGFTADPVFIGRVHCNKPGAICDGWGRIKHQTLHPGEGSRVCADAQAHRKRDYESESRMLKQHSRAITQVLPKTSKQIALHVGSPNYWLSCDGWLDPSKLVSQ